MRISLDKNYTATKDQSVLGYIGETNSRSITFSGLIVDGADTYSMIFDYGDSKNYEVDITNGKYEIDGSVLKQSGDVECQIVAKKTSGNGYSLIKKSNIFKLKIGRSASETCSPIPTYENSLSVINDINNKMGDLSLQRISRDDYDSAEHRADTVYYVTDQDGSVKQYLGDTKISSGGGGNSPSEAVVYCDPAPETVIAQVNGTSIDLSDPTLWEKGNIDEDGSDLNSTSIIRTKELIPINPMSMGLIFTSSVKNGKAREYAVVCFDENRSPIINGTWTWTKSGTAMYFDSGVHFVRIEDSYVQAAACSPADILTANLMILEE